jgi:hypothetical protein
MDNDHQTHTQDNDRQITQYDWTYGHMHDVCLKGKPSTINNVAMTGRTETFIVETMRHPDLGDYIFVRCVNESGTVIRLALPPKVANAIYRAGASLSKRSRSISSKATAKARMERGELPGFMRKKA